MIFKWFPACFVSLTVSQIVSMNVHVSVDQSSCLIVTQDSYLMIKESAYGVCLVSILSICQSPFQNQNLISWPNQDYMFCSKVQNSLWTLNSAVQHRILS